MASTWDLDADPTYDDGTDVVGFSAVEDLFGGSDTDDFTFSVAGLSGVVTVDGGGGTDSLTGRDVGSTWELDADPTYDDGMDVVGFSAVEDLLGGTNTDDFTFSVAGMSGVVTVDGGGGTDSLTGRDVASTWDLDADPTYDDGTDVVGFSAVEDLLGGTNTDDFTFSVAGLSGVVTVDGGGGTDSLTGRDVGSTWELDADPTYDDGTDVVGFSAVEDPLGGSDTDDFTFSVAGLSGVVTVDGGGGTDSLTGRGVASTWDLDADPTYDDGTDTVGFSAVEDLIGGSDTDDFTFSVAGLSGVVTVDGGGGTDSLTGRDVASTWRSRCGPDV